MLSLLGVRLFRLISYCKGTLRAPPWSTPRRVYLSPRGGLVRIVGPIDWICANLGFGRVPKEETVFFVNGSNTTSLNFRLLQKRSTPITFGRVDLHWRTASRPCPALHQRFNNRSIHPYSASLTKTTASLWGIDVHKLLFGEAIVSTRPTFDQ